MNSNLTKLEFNKILDILSTYCKTYIGKELCLSLLPSNNVLTVERTLKQTTQSCNMIIEHGNLPVEEIKDITPYIKNLESYISLSPEALLEIAKILKISSNLKDYFNNYIESNNKIMNLEEDTSKNNYIFFKTIRL